MPAVRQLSFLPNVMLAHGGEVRAGRRKIQRPFDSKRPLHVVLRSSKARGAWSFLHQRNKRRVEAQIERTARACGVRVYRLSNVGNHLHLLLRARTRRDLQRFLRAVAGRIAALVTGATRGRAGRSAVAVRAFWDHLAFSRIVSWGREFRTVQLYLVKNLFEAANLWDRKRHPGWTLVRLSEIASGHRPPD